MSTQKKQIISGWEILLIIIFFLLFSYLTKSNIDTLKSFMGQSYGSMFIFFCVTAMAVIIAPINSEPLIPLASNIWGWQIAGLLTLLGWTLGSLVAFVIARRYGISLLKKWVPIKKINELEKFIPHEHVFWSIVFLRMTIPADLFSYVLGLFSEISTKKYLLATFIGLVPFSFALAYVGELPLFYQLMALSTGLLVILLGILIALAKKK